MVVVLDAGHGGKDPGAVSPTGLQEKDVALQIVEHVKKHLSRPGGYRVLLTRTDDSYVSPAARARFANDARADAFVSVHCNAASSPTAQGYETLYHPSSVLGTNLAVGIQTGLRRRLRGPDRGTKPRPDLTVLSRTKMPAALVEVGFISNPGEERWLGLPSTHDLLGRVLCSEIIWWWEHR